MRLQRGPDAEPERALLDAHDEEFHDRERHPPINADALRHIAEPQGFSAPSRHDVDVPVVAHLADEGEDERGLARAVGAHDDGAASLRDRGVDVLKDGEPAPAHGYVAEDDGVSWFQGCSPACAGWRACFFRNSPAVRWPDPLRRGPALPWRPRFHGTGWRRPCPDTAVP